MGHSFFLKSKRQLDRDLTSRAPRVSRDRSRELAGRLLAGFGGNVGRAALAIGVRPTTVREWAAGRKSMHSANAQAIERLIAVGS